MEAAGASVQLALETPAQGLAALCFSQSAVSCSRSFRPLSSSLLSLTTQQELFKT